MFVNDSEYREFVAHLFDKAAKFFNIPEKITMFFVEPQHDSRMQGFFNSQHEWLVVYNRERSILSILQTLCHEIVHAQQYLQGRLFIDSEVFQFEGQDYSRDYPYLEQPWEVEAYGLQDTYLDQFINSCLPIEDAEKIALYQMRFMETSKQ